jgi:hypothetical protein
MLNLSTPAWTLSEAQYKDILQEHWEETRDNHFGKKGTRYWIDRAEKYGINPKKDLQTLEAFLSQDISLCDPKELREKHPWYFVPEILWGTQMEKIHQYKSSGSTGAKKPYLWDDKSLDYNAAMDNKILDDYGVGEGLNWLVPGTYGLWPAILERVVRDRKSIMDFMPVELGGLKKYLSPTEPFNPTKHDPFLMARFGPAIEYTINALSKGIEVQGKKRGVDVLSVLPQLLPVFEMVPGFDLVKVLIISMDITPEKFREIRNKYPNKTIFSTYGNSNSGLFPSMPGNLIYYSPSPLSLIDVVDEQDPLKVLKFGERGRLRNLKLSESFLWNEPQERDYAEKAKPSGDFKWSGISNVSVKWD